MSFTTVAGLTTHYTFEGRGGDRVLVFVNSLGTDLRLWDELMPELAAHFAIVRYDLRGHGLTDCPAGPYAIDDFADDLEGLVAALELDELALVGSSIGGMIALEFAARRPDLIDALILLDTQARIGSAEGWDQRIEAVQQQGLPRLAPQVMKIWFSEQFAGRRPEVAGGFRNMLVRSPAEGYTASCAALRDADLSDRLGAVQSPTLVMAGEYDRSTTPDQCRQLAESLPAGRFSLIEGAGHLPSVERPNQVARQLTGFLKEHGYA